MNDEFQYYKKIKAPEELPRYSKHRKYVFECAICGKDVDGYAKSKVKGKVLCTSCYKERQKRNVELLWKRKLYGDLEEKNKSTAIYKQKTPGLFRKAKINIY